MTLTLYRKDVPTESMVFHATFASKNAWHYSYLKYPWPE